MEYRKIKGVKHCVYEHISDFYNDHPNETPLKNWRESKEGDWVWSDDSRIVQILKSAPINHPNDRRNYKYCKNYVRTVVGSFLCLPKTYMDTDFQNPLKIPENRFIKGRYQPRKKRYLQLMSQLAWGRLKAIWMRLVKLVRTKLKRKRQSF